MYKNQLQNNSWKNKIFFCNFITLQSLNKWENLNCISSRKQFIYQGNRHLRYFNIHMYIHIYITYSIYVYVLTKPCKTSSVASGGF